jgi:hypothetical protein
MIAKGADVPRRCTAFDGSTSAASVATPATRATVVPLSCMK